MLMRWRILLKLIMQIEGRWEEHDYSEAMRCEVSWIQHGKAHHFEAIRISCLAYHYFPGTAQCFRYATPGELESCKSMQWIGDYGSRIITSGRVIIDFL